MGSDVSARIRGGCTRRGEEGEEEGMRRRGSSETERPVGLNERSAIHLLFVFLSQFLL